MKKIGLIVGGLIVLLVIYFVFLRSPVDTVDTTSNGVNQEHLQDIEIIVESNDNNDMDISEQDTSKTEKRDTSYEIFKHQQQISYEELDRIEQLAVNFIADFFTAPEDETKEELAERLKEYFHKEVPPLEVLDVIVKNDRFPHEGERVMQAVYLLPEYLIEEGGYAVPLQVNYQYNGHQVEEVIHLYIAKGGELINGETIISDDPELEEILGHIPRQDFVNEIVRKYNLDGSQ